MANLITIIGACQLVSSGEGEGEAIRGGNRQEKSPLCPQ